MSTSIWRELAISPSTDEREIRRAYARRLKIVHPEDDPEGFQALRAAFEQAMNHARHAAWSAQDWPEDEAVGEGLDSAPAPAQVAADHTAAVSTLDQAPQQDPALVAEIERDRAERAEHQRRCDALSEALRHPSPDDEAVLTALVAVFRSPALGALDVHESTEQWLGQLAGQRGPGFDALLEPTITFFGWDNRPVGDHWNPGLGALQHREDIATIRRLRNPDSPAHASFVALSQPVGWRERMRARLQPELGRRIADLLARIDHEVPYVLGYLNPASVAWWREHLSRPRFGVASAWFTGIVTLLSALFTSAASPPGLGAVGFAAGAGVGLFGSILLALAGHYLFILPRWRQTTGLASDNFWRSCGWAPAMALLMLATAFVPPGDDPAQSAVAIATGLAGIGLVWWAALTIDPDRWRDQLHWLWLWLSLIFPLWFIGGAHMAQRPALYVALLTLMILLPLGGLHLARRWPNHGSWSQRANWMLAATAALGAALCLASTSFPVGTLGAAVLFLTGTAGALATPHLHPWLVNLRRWVSPLGLMAIFFFTITLPADLSGATFFVWGGAWFCGVLALTALGDLFRDRLPRPGGHSRPKRRKSADRFA
ncbi:hypothetical protein D3C72_740000 [compost metagenome]